MGGVYLAQSTIMENGKWWNEKRGGRSSYLLKKYLNLSWCKFNEDWLVKPNRKVRFIRWHKRWKRLIFPLWRNLSCPKIYFVLVFASCVSQRQSVAAQRLFVSLGLPPSKTLEVNRMKFISFWLIHILSNGSHCISIWWRKKENFWTKNVSCMYKIVVITFLCFSSRENFLEKLNLWRQMDMEQERFFKLLDFGSSRFDDRLYNEKCIFGNSEKRLKFA